MLQIDQIPKDNKLLAFTIAGLGCLAGYLILRRKKDDKVKHKLALPYKELINNRKYPNIRKIILTESTSNKGIFQNQIIK